MKLIRFKTDGSASPQFGTVIQNQAVSFAALQRHRGQTSPHLTDSRAYLAGLPESEQAAKELLAWGEQHLSELSEALPLDAVQLLEPVEVAALFDLGLTPRHLKNSIEIMGKYEQDNPQTSALLKAFSQVFFAPKAPLPPGQPEALAYYKSNMNAIVGNDVTIP